MSLTKPNSGDKITASDTGDDYDSLNLIKAWVNFNGIGTVSITESFNVTSITDNGTGNYIVHFTSNFSNTNYLAAGVLRKDNDTTSGCESIGPLLNSGKTISAYQFFCRYAGVSGGGVWDCPEVNIAFYNI